MSITKECYPSENPLTILVLAINAGGEIGGRVGRGASVEEGVGMHYARTNWLLPLLFISHPLPSISGSPHIFIFKK